MQNHLIIIIIIIIIILIILIILKTKNKKLKTKKDTCMALIESSLRQFKARSLDRCHSQTLAKYTNSNVPTVPGRT